jgi:hypothetical protein
MAAKSARRKANDRHDSFTGLMVVFYQPVLLSNQIQILTLDQVERGFEKGIRLLKYCRGHLDAPKAP